MDAFLETLAQLDSSINAHVQPVADALGGIIWGWPMLILLIFTGVLFTVRLGFLQFRQLCPALCLAFSRYGRQKDVEQEEGEEKEGDISHFQALMTALSATVGTGNIAGVATAVAAGGPGALFWMWITGLLGMATKFAEAVLGVHYRERTPSGDMAGGPMYYIVHGFKDCWNLNARWLAVLFSIFLAVAAIGIGNMVQSNSMALLVAQTFSIPPWVTGLILAVLAGMVIIGGIKRIGQVASAIVPFMILLYVGAGSFILIKNIHIIPELFGMIFKYAFTDIAAIGGFAGAAVKKVMQMGFSRGVFSNESGMGSSPIAAAAAKTKHPVEQALVSMTQTFIDTLVVCTFTGLVLLASGLWTSGATGAELTGAAFGDMIGVQLFGLDVGSMIVAISLLFFAFSTMIGWSYYGDRGILFVFGERAVPIYRAVFIAAIFLGALLGVKFAWNIAEICTGLMIVPNLIALIFLSGKVRALTLDYFRNERDNNGYALPPFFNKHQ